MSVEKELVRCQWCGDDPLYQAYHDTEWGVPSYDDETLFEMLILEGAQAGLSWITVLKRREGYRRAFSNFSVADVAAYDEADVERLLLDEGIIRHKLKIKSAIKNAKIFLDIQKEFGSFSNFVWGYVKHKPIDPQYKKHEKIPVTTDIAEALSKDLKKRGMSFVGPIIVYSFMQAAGLVNDHIADCFTRSQLNKG